MSQAFRYAEAFSRNIGWVTHAEQARIKASRVAIAGMGGVGGVHLLTLARLGVGAFSVADFDRFDIANFNRQSGASVSSLGRPKVQVLRELALDVNPELELTVFEQGVSHANIDDFLRDADVYVDGLDFFAFEARRATFAACRRLGIPAVTAAPLGMGVALLTFMPDGMSFEDYFQWGDLPDDEKALRFMIGLAPRLLQDYIADESAVDLVNRRGPSTIMACQLCAGTAATEVLKLLLDRGKVRSAPHGLHYDAYRNKLVHTWRPWGNRHPVQRLMLAVARRRLAAMQRHAVHAPTKV